jgi:MurNAc alpha-1-phosphate uridylyltransferase
MLEMPARMTTAIVLAAGLGKRMRPITDAVPKPLVELGGKPLIDHVLDALAESGVDIAVVNVHHLADQVERYVRRRERPRIVISDERGGLLETGGAVVKALGHLGPGPFLVCNSDAICLGAAARNIRRLSRMWDDRRMDTLLLLASAATSIGFPGTGDFAMDADGVVRRPKEREIVPFAFTGTSLAHPRLFEGMPSGPFSLNVPWDRAIAARRCFGLRQDGLWMHIGTPESLAEGERYWEVGDPYF